MLINFSPNKIILATTTLQCDDQLVEKVKKYGIGIFRGEVDNVLKRFIDAAEKFRVEKIIRVCADNPFLLNSVIQQLSEYANYEFDYVSYITSNKLPVIKSHLGLYAELMKVETLKRIARLTNDSKYLEHVTNFIYEHDHLFKINWISVDEEIYDRKDIRLTIDTKTDFDLMKQIYELYYLNYEDNISNLIKIIEKGNDFLVKMKSQIDENIK